MGIQEFHLRACTVAWRVEPLPVMLVFTQEPVCAPAALLQNQFPANIPGKVAEVCPDGAPGFNGSSSAQHSVICRHLGMNQEDYIS